RSRRETRRSRHSTWDKRENGARGLIALAFHALALQLTEAADGLGALARLLLRRLLEMPAGLHFAEYALALHLLLERPEGLVDVIVANDDLHGCSALLSSLPGLSGRTKWDGLRGRANPLGRRIPAIRRGRLYSTGSLAWEEGRQALTCQAVQLLGGI